MKVEVYYNLHKHCWSVRHKGRVIKHCDHIWLTDVEFVVQPAGRAKVLATKRKNVHAFVRGTWEKLGFSVAPNAGVAVMYNPYKYSSFVRVKDENPIDTAGWAVLSNKKVRAGNRRKGKQCSSK